MKLLTDNEQEIFKELSKKYYNNPSLLTKIDIKIPMEEIIFRDEGNEIISKVLNTISIKEGIHKKVFFQLRRAPLTTLEEIYMLDKEKKPLIYFQLRFKGIEEDKAYISIGYTKFTEEETDGE